MLQQATEQWRIAYFHHPLYGNARRHGANVDLRVSLELLLLEHRVQVVFSGHAHVYEHLKPPKGIHYLIGGLGRDRSARRAPAVSGRRALPFRYYDSLAAIAPLSLFGTAPKTDAVDEAAVLTCRPLFGGSEASTRSSRVAVLLP